MSALAAELSELEGPLEVTPGVEALAARVVTPGGEPRVRGYDVESDLARHYHPSELSLLALTGELPSSASAAAFEVVQMFLAPVSVAHASTHAAVLARLCGARPSAVIAVAATALAEQAREEVAEHDALLSALVAGEPPPARFEAASDDELEASRRLRQALAPCGVGSPCGAKPLKRMAELLATLVVCGLTRREQLEAAIVQARLMTTVAEAFAEHKANFNRYPSNVPRFCYEGDR
ncbi:MAG TPA: hypothetical protein VFQ35_09310 [Polyangiaceae bacterium]|nr:hypothetical protein [Polyangiaceae bacterium]